MGPLDLLLPFIRPQAFIIPVAHDGMVCIVISIVTCVPFEQIVLGSAVGGRVGGRPVR